MKQSVHTSRLLQRLSPETVFYALCWLFIFLVPIFQEAFEYGTGNEDKFNWNDLGLTYLSFIPFLLLFSLCKLVFEPLLFFKGHPKICLLAGLLSAVIITLSFSFILPRGPHHHPHKIHNTHASRPFQLKNYLALYTHTTSSPNALTKETFRQPNYHFFYPPKHENVILSRLTHGPFLPLLLMSLLMEGCSLGIAIAFRNRKIELELKKKEAAHLQSELDYLKFQINPHFFMNTLNNIHALVDIDSELAKSAIIELSRMMRYLLYESNHPTVSLSSELSFISHYIELMRLRYTDTVTITMQTPPAQHPDLQNGVPPLLLITFVENAFKHGISPSAPSFIHISLTVENQQFHFAIENSMPPVTTSSSLPHTGGVGLENVRKRLALIYPHQHRLEINQQEGVFSVNLFFPLSSSLSSSLASHDTMPRS